MKYYEMNVTVFLKKELTIKNIGEKLSNHINYCMHKSELLKSLHAQQGPKLYCYDYLFPLEKTKKYEKGRVYVFRIRTPKEKIASEMRRTLTTYETDHFKPLGVDLKSKRFYRIEEIRTITPAIATFNNRNLTNDDGLDRIWEMLDNNLERKSRMIFGEAFKARESCIEFLEFTNKKNIVMDYKGGKVFGNKFNLRFKQDDISQKMAYAAITSGILEKSSSIGAGFCKPIKRG